MPASHDPAQLPGVVGLCPIQRDNKTARRMQRHLRSLSPYYKPICRWAMGLGRRVEFQVIFPNWRWSWGDNTVV
jgi:hypothetical protein